MQEPTWRDVVAYIASALRNGDWPFAKWVAIALVFVLVRFLASWAWARHRQQQQLDTVKFIFGQWVDGLAQPFWTLSTSSQLDSIQRLRGMLVGNRDVVLALLIGLRVQLEAVPVDDTVLEAFDRLAAEWQDNTANARRRRYRQVRELAAQRKALLRQERRE